MRSITSLPTFAAAKNSPHLEIFRKKGTSAAARDRVDEWGDNLTEFEGKPLKSSRSARSI